MGKRRPHPDPTQSQRARLNGAPTRRRLEDMVARWKERAPELCGPPAPQAQDPRTKDKLRLFIYGPSCKLRPVGPRKHRLPPVALDSSSKPLARFWVCSLGVVTAIAEVVLIQGRFGSSLPASAAIWTFLAPLVLMSLWTRAWREHSRLGELLRQSASARIEEGSPLDAALRSATVMTFYGLAVASVSVIAALIGLSKALAGLRV